MATGYKVSPFDTPALQSYIVRGTEVDEDGKVNAIGTSGTVNAIHISAGAGSNYILIWDGVAATDQVADIVIPTDNSDDLTVYIDKGIVCSTAITFAASSVPQGGTAPSGTNPDISIFAT
tara:strand:- start:2619 stop:2978 length:360 start_codon:yes stop_codon:yes gene_type:complete